MRRQLFALEESYVMMRRHTNEQLSDLAHAIMQLKSEIKKLSQG